MQKIILVGCNGRMGRVISEMLADDNAAQIVCGVDVNTQPATYPVYADLMEYCADADVLIDFSNPSALNNILTYCERFSIPAVLCATGYTSEQLERIESASEVIPVFRSGNMSIGINLMLDLIQRTVGVLGDGYDIEIIEKHHNKKLDAPSGTALMLADAANKARGGNMEYVCDRSAVRSQRQKQEIGISSIRGGTIVGEHEIIFSGHDEVISITHSIGSREIFASGAIKAARFMAEVHTPGLYSMADVIQHDND